jgi:hypothetical protein
MFAGPKVKNMLDLRLSLPIADELQGHGAPEQ